MQSPFGANALQTDKHTGLVRGQMHKTESLKMVQKMCLEIQHSVNGMLRHSLDKEVIFSLQNFFTPALECTFKMIWNITCKGAFA